MHHALSYKAQLNTRAHRHQIIADEGLDHDETYRFVDNAFRDGVIQSTGTAISKILPPVSRFSADNSRGKKRETVLDKLTNFFNKFFDISDGRLS